MLYLGKKKQTNLFCVERSHQITRNRSIIYAINTEIVFLRCNIYFSALTRHVYCFSCTAQMFLVKGILKGHYFCVSYLNLYYCKMLHKCAGIVLYSITYLSFEIKVWFRSLPCCYFKDCFLDVLCLHINGYLIKYILPCLYCIV